ncbi:Urb2 domain containing protein [Pyrenophora tritici-repentis]|nr:Urb2 domain containing protein [Pyrenophora tritici-repentis]
MALNKTASKNDPASTRPRLQAINQDFSDLDEQICQAAQIIGLPENWSAIQEQEEKAEIIRRLVRARAEWVLRWVLDKLKDDAEIGRTARGNVTAWQLLDWMIHVLPVSRSAPHLRDASFPSILEKTLVENFDKDMTLLPTAESEDVHMKDDSESSETVREGTKPSKKRKRGTAEKPHSTSATLGPVDRSHLFRVVRLVVESIVKLAAGGNDDDITQAELMKMVLRTESTQASRILRFWLTAVYQIADTMSQSNTQSSQVDDLIDLPLVIEIWDLRTADTKDETGASAEEFNTECLVPTLTLLEQLKSLRDGVLPQFSACAIHRATATLDKLLARHLLAPSRAAFFSGTDSTVPAPSMRDSTVLESNLEPLRAKLLSAAQIEDGGDTLPNDLASLFNAVPHILDLAIRVSPSRTPKSRSMEKPWLQATFSALAGCAGCSITTPPEFITRQTAVAGLSGALRVLQVHQVGLTPDLVRKIFWYHCGVKYPERQERQVHWLLIAALIELEASVFVREQKANAKLSQEQHTNLAEFIFESISLVELEGSGFPDAENESRTLTSRATILDKIIKPLMSAFVRNRNLLGFIQKWDDQLVQSYRHGKRKALTERQDIVWEDRALHSALAEVFEQSLTQGQITTLFQEHRTRLAKFGRAIETASKEDVKIRKLAAYKNAVSSAILLPALLQSVQSDTMVEALQPDLHALLLTYATWVQEDTYAKYTQLQLSWFTLCQLLAKLWPIELHDFLDLQQELLHPLLKQAIKDISTGHRDNGHRIGTPAQAAAIVFWLNTCDQLQTVPGSEEIIRDGLGAVISTFASTQLEPDEHMKMVELFCAYSVKLLEHMDAGACRESLCAILSKFEYFGESTSDLICRSLSQSIIQHGNSLIQQAYSAALLQTLGQEGTGTIHPMVLGAVLHIRPAALSREQRQSILDRTADLLNSGRATATGLLSVFAHLQQVPNATAKITVDPSIIFSIADQLCQQNAESDSALQLLRELVQRTLGHIIPNQSQAQNKEFFIEFSGKLLSITKATDQISLARLSILRATSLAQKQNSLLHIERYIDLLKELLRGEDIALLQGALDAFNELSIPVVKEVKLFSRLQTHLRTWMADAVDLNDYQGSMIRIPVEVIEYVARVYTLVTKFELYQDIKWLIRLTLTVLRGSPTHVQDSVYKSLREVIEPLPCYEKLDLVSTLAVDQQPPNVAASYRILSDLINSMDDKLEDNAELTQKQLALLPRICVLLAESPDFESFNALLDCVDTILNDKPLLASQYGVECVFSILVKLTSRNSPALTSQYASEIFTRLCHTSRLILLVHRGRLGGRFHLLLPLLQGLLFCLFIPNASRSGALPTWLRRTTATQQVHLTPTNATQFSRLLSTLCNPPQSSITKAHQHHQSRKSKDLNDPIKAAREKASNFLYPLLASFCRYQLNGRLDQEVRERLMIGIFEIVGTASLHRESLDAMFAGLGRSERDVWKGLWEEWESVHGRRQVVGHGE